MARSANTDGKLSVVPWTAELALRVLRASKATPRDEVVKRARAAVKAGSLAPEAVKALKGAGYAV